MGVENTSGRTWWLLPRRFAGFMFVLTLSLIMTVPASAQYPTTSGDLTVDEFARCEWALEGSGYSPGVTITIDLSRTGTIGTVIADATGSFSYTLQIDRAYTRGRQTLSASGQNTIGGLHTLSKSVVVKDGCRNAGVGFIDRLPAPPSAPGQLVVGMATALTLAGFVISARIEFGRSTS